MGWMIGSRIDDITRSADARMSWLPFSRSRWNELTESSARSQSRPIATTSARYLVASPRFFTLTTAKLSTQCAFVRMRRALMQKPEPELCFWLMRLHGAR